tara:strand:- start:332 stop:544 length:213 start_codon:yes stop_codon:yes gene_type:complete
LLNVEDMLFERRIDNCHETVSLGWNRFGPMFAADIRRQRVCRLRGFVARVGHQSSALVGRSLAKHREDVL